MWGSISYLRQRATPQQLSHDTTTMTITKPEAGEAAEVSHELFNEHRVDRQDREELEEEKKLFSVVFIEKVEDLCINENCLDPTKIVNRQT